MLLIPYPRQNQVETTPKPGCNHDQWPNPTQIDTNPKETAAAAAAEEEEEQDKVAAPTPTNDEGSWKSQRFIKILLTSIQLKIHPRKNIKKKKNVPPESKDFFSYDLFIYWPFPLRISVVIYSFMDIFVSMCD